MNAIFFFSAGRDYSYNFRQSLLDRNGGLLAGSVAQGSNLTLGPPPGATGDTTYDQIGLSLPASQTFMPAFGAQQSALTAASGGYCFYFNTFTGNATAYGSIWSDWFFGGSGNDAFHGGKGIDRLYGGLGNDTLNGGTGNDRLEGGKGNDGYIVDSSGDLVLEAAGEGQDTITSSVSFRLRAGSEIETLQLAPSTGTQALNLIGNEFVNRLTGNDGANGLNGGAGSDVMAGGKGNDYYLVDNWVDEVFEGAGGGFDTVYASADHCFTDGQEVEVLRANAGSKGLHLMGNELAQTIIGGAGDDVLHGDGGADILQGAGGRDTFAFVARVDATPGIDRPTIVDFRRGEDSIFLKKLQAVDGAATDQAFTWIGTGAFTKQAGQLHQVALGSDTMVEGDTNGDGAADIQIVLKGIVSLQATDFTL